MSIFNQTGRDVSVHYHPNMKILTQRDDAVHYCPNTKIPDELESLMRKDTTLLLTYADSFVSSRELWAVKL